jgi:hypothetical protein
MAQDRSKANPGSSTTRCRIKVKETHQGRFHHDLSREREEGRSETALRHGDAKLRRSALEGAFPSLNIEFETLESNIGFPASGLRGLSDVVGQILRAHGIDRAVSPKVVRNLLSKSGVPVLGSYRGGEIKVNAGAADPGHVVRREIIHALRDANLWGQPYGLFTGQEWRALVRAARADEGIRRAVERAYDDLDAAGQAEEMVAEFYADWAADRAKYPPGPVMSALERIHTFFRALGAALRGEGFMDAAMVMDRIANGEIGGRGGPEGGPGGRIMYQRGESQDREVTVTPGIDLAQPLNLVSLKSSTPKMEMKATVRRALADIIKAEAISTRDGVEVAITANAAGKLGNFPKGNWSARTAVTMHLSDVVSEAVIYGTAADDAGADRAWQYAAAVVEVDGQPFAVRFAIKRAGGRSESVLYALNGYDVRRLGVSKPEIAEIADAESETGQVHRAASYTLADAVDAFNDGKMLFQRDLSGLKAALSRSKGGVLGMLGNMDWKRTPKEAGELFSNFLTDAMGRNARFNILSLVPGQCKPCISPVSRPCRSS